MENDRLNTILYFDPKDPKSKSVTQQHFRDECDINNIMKKYEKNGTLPDGYNEKQPIFGDFSEIPDFQSTANLIAEVQTAFNKLPASTRARFNHSPAAALDFLADSNNTAEAFKLGLVSQETLDAYNKATAPVEPSQASADAESTGVITP